MKIARIISRVIAGLVFIFSGFVKVIDPLGSAYKFSDYFQSFHLDFLKPGSLPLAVLLCTLEFITGVSLITGLRQKAGRISVFIMVLIFTPLTFILALFNPVSDCGCFGDAVHLTNWQTFGKNLVLLLLALILLTGRNSLKALLKPASEWLLLLIVTILFVGFSFYNLRHLPVIDFLPYKTGTNISEKMKIPDGALADQYSTIFIYEKDGSRKEFTINNYPVNDSTWKFVEQKSVLVKKGFVPSIHDFSIVSMQQEDITQKVLNNSGLTILMISKKLEEADVRNLMKGFEFGSYCDSTGIDFYILTSSGSEEVRNLSNGLKFCNTDETALKTMIRSNPGYIVLKNGIIIGKWSWADISKLRILLDNKRNSI